MLIDIDLIFLLVLNYSIHTKINSFSNIIFRVSSTRGTVRSRSTARGKARQIVKSDSSKEAPTKSRTSLLSKLKNLMQVPKAHPVSISDELSGGSRYFGAAGIFGAASESQESTGLF